MLRLFWLMGWTMMARLFSMGILFFRCAKNFYGAFWTLMKLTEWSGACNSHT
jgi:hypothetical protein